MNFETKLIIVLLFKLEQQRQTLVLERQAFHLEQMKTTESRARQQAQYYVQQGPSSGPPGHPQMIINPHGSGNVVLVQPQQHSNPSLPSVPPTMVTIQQQPQQQPLQQQQPQQQAQIIPQVQQQQHPQPQIVVQPQQPPPQQAPGVAAPIPSVAQPPNIPPPASAVSVPQQCKFYFFRIITKLTF